MSVKLDFFIIAKHITLFFFFYNIIYIIYKHITLIPNTISELINVCINVCSNIIKLKSKFHLFTNGQFFGQRSYKYKKK